MIKTGVTRLGNGWIQDGVKFVDYVIPLIPNHAAAGFGTSIVSLTESQAGGSAQSHQSLVTTDAPRDETVPIHRDHVTEARG